MESMAESNCRYAAALLLVAWWVSSAAAAAAGFSDGCAGPSRFDPLVYNSSLYGVENLPDSIWHDDSWAHRRFGPISRLTMYEAWYYDGAWHNPGEFKGLQAWHGRYYKTEEDTLLFGAKRPHFPYNCTLYRDEVFVAAEIQWDHIMRFMNFTTNRGRYCAWGFPDVAGVVKGVAVAPGPNTYIAALRGYEGKPLPPSQGGFKKRYIVQLGFAWAQLNCSNTTQAAGNASNVTEALNATAALYASAEALPPPPDAGAAAAAGNSRLMPPAAITAAPAPSGEPNTILAAAAEAMAAAAAAAAAAVASPTPATAANAAAAAAAGVSPEPPAPEAPAWLEAPSAALIPLASPVPIPVVPLDEAKLQAMQLQQQKQQQDSNVTTTGLDAQPGQQSNSAPQLSQLTQQGSSLNASITVPNGAAGSLQSAAVLEQPAVNATDDLATGPVQVQPTASAAVATAAANTTTQVLVDPIQVGQGAEPANMTADTLTGASQVQPAAAATAANATADTDPVEVPVGPPAAAGAAAAAAAGSPVGVPVEPAAAR